LQRILQKVDQAKAPAGPGGMGREQPKSPFAEITEDDIDKLFG
jgi:hypothetical protein